MLLGNPLFVWVTIATCAVPLGLVQSYGYHHFNGGTMSYSIKETNVQDQHEVHISLITGWVLCKGPCGPGCTKADVGRDTAQTRQFRIQSHNDSYFGRWYKESSIGGVTSFPDVTHDIMVNMIEKVIGVSETAQWEQELLETTFLLNVTKDDVGIEYKGQSWRHRTEQGMASDEGERWNLQTNLKLGIRSDTNKPNQSPVAYVKPYYRVKLGKVSTLHISAYDPDGDFVKCRQSKFSEALSLSLRPMKGLEVHSTCEITLDASASLGYTDDYWGGVAVTVRDYNKRVINVGGSKVLAGDFASLGSAPVQFLVVVLEHLEVPKFILPTLENNHEFVVYPGAVWSVTVYAEAVLNTTIDEFQSYGIQGENVIQTDFKDDDLKRERVKQTTVSWKPVSPGRHIICTRVMDNTGVDSSEDKCFIVNVKEQMFSSTLGTGSGKPYFLDMPSTSEKVSCNVDKTCTLPIYVSSTVKVDKLTVTSSAIDKIYFGAINLNGTNVFRSDLFMRHSGYGDEKICLVATDIQGISSDEVCILFDIEPPDPCYSFPCSNSGECVRRVNDTSDYECANCPPGFSGKNCEKKEPKFCDSKPCEHGLCADKVKKCYCLSSGFDGPTCSMNKDDCKNQDCSNRGVCIDGINSHTCQCFKRYSGNNCATDRCNSQPVESQTCPGDVTGCAANTCQNGVCMGNNICLCQMAYNTDNSCSQGIGNIRTNFNNVTILPPTPEPRSKVLCYVNEACDITVYFTSGNQASTTVTVNKITESLASNVTVANIELSSDINGVNNMLKVTVTVTATKNMQGYLCALISEGNLSDQRCFALKFIVNPVNTAHSLEQSQQNKAIKFVDPTLRGESTLVCQQKQACYLFLYTSLNMTSTGSCDQPISTDEGVAIFHVEQLPTKCKTQVGIMMDKTGNFPVCFQSTLISGESQKRCFNLQIYNQDPCAVADCQNQGECFYTDDILGNITCKCQENYRGTNCEKGPCQPAANHCQIGYCDVNNHVTACLCPLGYKGNDCEQNLPSTVTDPANTGALFTDVAFPTEVLCIRNKDCVVPMIASGHYQGTEMPDIRPGYTSSSVNIASIETRDSGSGSFAVNVNLRGKRVGLYDTCVLSMNKQEVNMDELCFKVKVTEATSTLYSDKETPHFVQPSIPPDSELVCKVNEPCHLLFNATPGDQHVNQECVKLTITPAEVAKLHVYSACEACTIGSPDQQFCHFDVVLLLTTGVDLCVEAVTTKSNVAGEKRCYKLKTESNTVKKGCQLLHCENNGFCDGHVNPAECHCRAGYSGKSCQPDNLSTTAGSSASNPLTGVGQLPHQVFCVINKPCDIPLHAVDPSLSLTTGYVTPGLKVNTSAGSGAGTSVGTINVASSTPGKKTVCLQAKQGSLTKDELCMTVDFSATTSGQTVDKARPYFLTPTPPKDSVILCNMHSTCHIDLHFTKGDVFQSSQSCPTVLDTSTPHLEGVYIFPSQENSQDCSSDLSYLTSSIAMETKNRLCVELSLPGKRGEERCFVLQIVPDIINEVTRPCAGQTCDNDAVCMADMSVNPPTGSCICTQGHTGTHCNTAVPDTNTLPGFVGSGSLTSPPTSGQTPHFDPNAGIPSNIACVENHPCLVQIPYKGDHNYPPLPGFISPPLNMSMASVLPSPVAGNNIAVFNIANPQHGLHKACLQTTVDGAKDGVNVDEVCFNLTVAAATSVPSTPVTSNFESGTYMNGSIVSCKTDATCHLQIVTKGSPNCPSLEECGMGVAGVHIFDSQAQGADCVTDVAVNTGHLHVIHDLCLTSGLPGDKREIQIEVKSTSEYGPCQKKHCQNGGFCKGQSSPAICECKIGYSGPECEIGPCTKPLPTILHGQFINSVDIGDKQKANFTCDPGYELMDPSKDTLTCDAVRNTWTGDLPSCKAKVTCLNDADCLNGGICKTGKCDCPHGYSNTNCDTEICYTPTPAHGTVVNQKAEYIDGETVDLNCLAGYALVDNNNNRLTCDAAATKWIGTAECLKTCTTPPPDVENATTTLTGVRAFPDGYVAVYTCDGGHQFAPGSTKQLTCDANTDSWTGAVPVCEESTCSGEAAILARNHFKTVIKEGKASCFCKVGNSANGTAKVTKFQLIKRRPTPSLTTILQHAGYGAGGMTGAFVLCLVLCHVIKRVKSKSQQNALHRKIRNVDDF